MERIIGFPFIGHGNDRILILGSMPSVKSLEENMYYAHKNNRFWHMLAQIYNMPIQTKDEKYQILEKNKIALWDICHTCLRQKSADSTIKEIVPNDIPTFLKDNPSIQLVICNGKTSYTLLKKYFPQLNVVSCPSTSSANAKYSLQDLIDIYKGAGL